MKIYDLNEKMHCTGDLDFSDLCDRIRKGNITEQDVEYLKSRVREQEIPEELDNENCKEGKNAIIVTTSFFLMKKSLFVL